MSSLFVIQGPDQGRRFDLPAGSVTTLGRDAANAIRLHDDEVSRKHAELHPKPEGIGFVLVDLDSANGTFVNNARTKRTTLTPGDHVKVGQTLMIYSGPAPRSSDELRTRVEVRLEGPTDRAQTAILKRIPPGEGSRILSASAAPMLAPSPSGSVEKVRLAHLAAVYQATLAVSHVHDIDALLPQVLEAACEATRAERGAILLRDESGGELTPRAVWWRGDLEPDDQLVISRTIADFVLEQGQGVISADAPADERFAGAPSIVNQGIREAICVPVQGRYTTSGVLYVDVRAGAAPGSRLSEDQLALLAAIAHQAGLAIENTRLYEAKLQSERLAAVGQTIATISHHIKNILQGLKSGSYLIQIGLDGKDDRSLRKGWSIVEKNQDKIYNLVMDMLSFSKEREPALEPNDLNETVGDVVDLMRARAAELGVALEFTPDPHQAPILFDSEGVHRAVLNLVNNALDASEGREGAQVSVEAARDATSARITVRDNGPGIPESEHESIFDVFSSTKGARGTGLGLPVTRKIAREHGGDVLIRSQVGAGTAFIVELPLRTEGPPAGGPDE